jgi:hypothetical protein
MDIGRWATSNAMTMTANVIGSGLEQLVILTTEWSRHICHVLKCFLFLLTLSDLVREHVITDIVTVTALGSISFSIIG